MKKTLVSLSLLSLSMGGCLIFPSSAVAQHWFDAQKSNCSAVLRADNPSSQINLREQPTVNSRKLGYGLVGDSVFVLGQYPPEADYSRDSQGKIWHRVGFPQSQATGWIRQDFLVLTCSRD